MTKESDRFEELLPSTIEIVDNKEYYRIEKKDLKEMLSIYRALKLQIVNQTDAVQKDKLQYYEKEISALHTKIDFLETELKDYKDTLKENRNLNEKLEYYINSFTESKKEKEKLEKENSELKERIEKEILLTKDIADSEKIFLERMEVLKKENEQMKEYINSLRPKSLTKEDMNRKLDQFNNIE